jgi:hypothetical protein
MADIHAHAVKVVRVKPFVIFGLRRKKIFSSLACACVSAPIKYSADWDESRI